LNIHFISNFYTIFLLFSSAIPMNTFVFCS